MKHFAFVVFVIFSICYITHGQSSCLPEGITFARQGQIDSFQINYPGCTEISGNVAVLPEVSNLYGLQTLQTIGGYLIIEDNPTLLNFQGLNNVASIGNYMRIARNKALIDFSGLENLTTLSGDLSIFNDSSLLNFDALYNLTNFKSYIVVGGNILIKNLYGFSNIDSADYIGIGYNDALTNLNGLQHIANVGNTVIISYNPALENLNGLNKLTTIGYALSIWGNTHLKNLAGLDSLREIKGDMQIASNPELASLESLQKLQSVEGPVRIFDNQVLPNLYGLENLSHLGDNLDINYNPALSNLAIFNKLRRIGGELRIDDNDDLINLSGLDSLRTIGSLLLRDNQSFTDLSALIHLDTIELNLQVTDNESLATLHGLENLKSIYRDFILINNPLLADISALANASYGDFTELLLFNNSSLSNCMIPLICSTLLQGQSNVIINNNLPGCNSIEELLPVCQPVGIEEQTLTLQNWQLFSNPVQTIATFRSSVFIAGEKRFELSDAVGRVVRTEHFSGQEFEFRRGLLAGGLYYFRITDAQGRAFSGKIVVSE